MNARKLKSDRGVLAVDSARLELVREDQALPDRAWAEAALAGEKRVLEMIARGHSLLSILDALCLEVEEICRGSLCSILLLDVEGERLWQGAAPSLPQSYLAAFNGREIASCWGPCGAAAFRMEQVIAADIQADPLWDGCRDIVLSQGLRACWSTPIFSSEGRVLGILAILSRQPCSPTPEDHGIIKQFTHLASIAIERTRCQEALRRSEAYLAEAQKLSHTGSFGWNLATGKLVWSAETFGILGYEPALTPTLEMVLRRVHPDDVKVVRELIDRATREGSGFDLDHRLLMPNGTIKHLQVVARPSRTESGDVELVGAVMDITERKQAQEASRAAMARFEGILDIAEDAIISLNSDQRVILFNQGAEKTFGYAAAEVIGQPLDILLPSRFAPRHRAHIEAFAKSPEASRLMGQRRELFGRRKDGSEFPAEASISKLNLCAEVVFTVILRDITERKRAQAAVMAERNRMARDIHDTLAQGFTGVIVQLEAVEEAMSQRLMAKAGEHLTRAGELARESLQEARRSVRALRPRALEEKDLCEALKALIQKMTEGTNLQSNFMVQGELRDLPPEWEENLLHIGQEVLTNVLRHSQASKFIAQIAFDDGEIRLDLRDNGSGFDPAFKHDGFGMQGMRERVEGMGGQLAIQSSRSQGTAVSIVLPLAKAVRTAEL